MYYNPSTSFFHIHYVLFIIVSSSVDLLHTTIFASRWGFFLNLVRYLISSCRAGRKTQGLLQPQEKRQEILQKRRKEITSLTKAKRLKVQSVQGRLGAAFKIAIWATR